jgi:hypothetical protein
MPTPTYTLIDSVTLASSASSVTFSSISATGKGDLVLQMTPLATSSTGFGAVAYIRFNGDTGSNYSQVSMYGTGSSSASSQSTLGYIGGEVSNNDTYQTFQKFEILDYSATDKHKSVLLRKHRLGASTTVWATAVRWANTAAISSLSITASTGSFATGSTFQLFQIVSE